MATVTDRVAMTIAPQRVVRGLLAEAVPEIAKLGNCPLIVGGDRTLAAIQPFLEPLVSLYRDRTVCVSYGAQCSETALTRIQQAVVDHCADVIIGVGGGKALDAAKLVAHRCQLPVITVPTSAATCAAWTALSNVYSDQGAFLYDVGLPRCPDLLVLDYDIIQTAPQRTLVAGIGDALAKWYEASVSSGASEQTLVIAAVQQARVLRDLLLQRSAEALATPGSAIWREVVDA
ncbi:MAG: iron-containing alcohol dehydrogenase, partial [Cyanobacteria bacterium]|nr:iron-containing alcohol dehydrogenase [Cyanobacteriota bacterium]MDW8200112.1 iron-containing alcohol dehydrogenase [Cyanobacteriota bacterium SKYGB_h_bin112]